MPLRFVNKRNFFFQKNTNRVFEQVKQDRLFLSPSLLTEKTKMMSGMVKRGLFSILFYRMFLGCGIFLKKKNNEFSLSKFQKKWKNSWKKKNYSITLRYTRGLSRSWISFEKRKSISLSFLNFGRNLGKLWDVFYSPCYKSLSLSYCLQIQNCLVSGVRLHTEQRFYKFSDFEKVKNFIQVEWEKRVWGLLPLYFLKKKNLEFSLVRDKTSQSGLTIIHKFVDNFQMLQRFFVYKYLSGFLFSTFFCILYTKPHNIFFNVLWGSNYQTLLKKSLGTFFFGKKNSQRVYWKKKNKVSAQRQSTLGRMGWSVFQSFFRRVNHYRSRRRLSKQRYTTFISRGLLSKRHTLLRFWIKLRRYRCCFFMEQTLQPHNGCRSKKVPRKKQPGSRKMRKRVRQTGKQFLLYT